MGKNGLYSAIITRSEQMPDYPFKSDGYHYCSYITGPNDAHGRLYPGAAATSGSGLFIIENLLKR